jgi:hypothetical protein
LIIGVTGSVSDEVVNVGYAQAYAVGHAERLRGVTALGRLERG